MTEISANPRWPTWSAFAALFCVSTVLALLLAGGPASAAKSRHGDGRGKVGHGKCVADRKRPGRKARGSRQRGRCVRVATAPAGSGEPRATPKPSPEPAVTAPAGVEPGGSPAPQPPSPDSPPPEPEAPTPDPPAPDPDPPTPDPDPPVSSAARGESFAGQPADVLLPAGAGVDLGAAWRCVGLDEDGESSPFGGVDPGPSPGSIRLQLVPGGELPTATRCPVGEGTRTFAVEPPAPTAGGVLSDPIDPTYLTGVPFGRRSFWRQPWRAYLDTWPASRLLGAVGINFNVRPAEADGVARLLQSSGFRLGRIELSWNLLSYDDPSRFADPNGVRRRLVAMREHGLRPLILLNANSGAPGPAREVSLTTTAAAPAGARTVSLDGASAAAVVPGKTGFAALSFGGRPDVLIESVAPGGVAALSRPLPASLGAGPHPAATLRYGPFGPPRLSDGRPNPAFQETLAGWLSYVATVCAEADDVFGSGGYDLEIWNELSFGSEFLSETNYYSPARVDGSGSVAEALLEETVAFVRDPANDISDEVGISDGFAGQTPFAAAGSVPVGTTALSKHLYRGPQYFPRNAAINSIRPLDALGASDSTTSNAPYTPKFTPSFASALPEYFLTAIQTETVVRDLAPFATEIYGVPHGRAVGPPGGAPVETWMTEYNLNTNTLFPLGADDPDRYIGTASAAEKERLQAVIALRSLVSMTAKGMARMYFYAAAHSAGYSLVSDRFMNALNAASGAYPGDSFGGETMDALRRLLTRFRGPGPDGPTRRLELRAIAQEGDQAQFAGDGSAAHPDLYDRDLLAVFPFQSSPTRFVIPVYVMTPNLTTVYPGSAHRFDLPDQRFRITLGNLPASAQPPTVAAYDPMRDAETPARLVSRQGDRAVFEVAATNYPRLLTIDYPGD
jgi:hypothetical protein